MMSTKRLAIRGVLFSWFGRGVSFLVTFIITPIIIRKLGNEAYGVWAMVMSLSSYYSLADLGLRGASVKYIAQYEALNDRDSLSRLTVTAVCLYSGIGFLVLTLACLAAFVFPLLVDLREQSVADVRWAVFLTGAIVAAQLFAQEFSATLQALKRFDVSETLSVAAQIIQAVLMIGVVSAGFGLVAMALVVLSVTIAHQLAATVIARRLLPELSFRLALFDRGMLRPLFSFAALNVVRNTARRIVHYSGSLIVGVFLGPTMVAYYAIAEKLVEKAGTLNSSFSHVIMPVASQLEAQKRQNELIGMFTQASRLLFSLALTLTILLTLMGKPLVDLWIGPGYSAKVHPSLCILSVAFALCSLSSAIRPLLTGCGRLGFMTRLDVGGAAAMLLLSVPLVLWLGIVGMACAIAVPYVLIDAIVLPQYCCRVLNIRARSLFQKILLPACFAAMPGLAVCLILRNYFPPANLIQLVAEGASVVAVASISIFFICCDAALRQEIFRAAIPFRLRRPESATVGNSPVKSNSP